MHPAFASAFATFMNADPGAGGGPATAPAAPAAAPPGGPAATPPVAPVIPASAPAAPPAAPAIKATGNVVMDYALGELASLGIKDGSPALTLALEGNFDMLAVELAKTGKAGADGLLGLLKTQYSQEQASATQRAADTKATITKVFGDDATWQAASKWAGENATEAESAAINSMLARGGSEAYIASVALAAMWERAGGSQPQAAGPAPITKNTPSTGAANGPMTRHEYLTAVQELRGRVRTGIDNHPEYKALQARFAAGRR